MIGNFGNFQKDSDFLEYWAPGCTSNTEESLYWRRPWHCSCSPEHTIKVKFVYYSVTPTERAGHIWPTRHYLPQIPIPYCQAPGGQEVCTISLTSRWLTNRPHQVVTRARTRTFDLPVTRRTPYPLGHGDRYYMYRVLKNTLDILKLNNFFINYFFQKMSSPVENRTDRIYVICH